MSSDTGEVVKITNIKRIDIYRGTCAESGDTLAIFEVIDNGDQGYSMTLTLDQVMDTIMLLCNLKNDPPNFQASGDETLVFTDSIEIIDLPESH